MKRLITCICILTVGTSCVLRTPKRTPKYENERSMVDSLTVFLTGNELGALKPCGCSGGQLGVFDRLSAALNTVPEQKRLIINTGSFVESDSEQDLIKYHIIIQALQLLDYDLVSLSEKDIEIGSNLGLLEGIESAFDVISPHSTSEMNVPAKFTKQFSLKGRTVLSTVAAFDPESTPVEPLEGLFALPSAVPTLTLLILSNSDPG